MSLGLMPMVYRRGPPADPAMILVFDTSLEAGEQVTLPLQGTVDCNVDWGDGTDDAYTTADDKTHTYGSGGVYTVRITGTLTQFGKSAGGTYANVLKMTECQSFGDVGLTNINGAFIGAANLTVAPAALPAAVTNLRQTFDGCTSFNQDIGGWNTANVTGMFGVFAGATSFNQELGSWNVANSTTFNGIFNGATAFQGAGLDQWGISGLVGAGGLNDFATGCTFTTANYDALLIAWEAAKAGYRADLSPNFGNSKYTGSSAASAARAALVSYGWTITDGGTA